LSGEKSPGWLLEQVLLFPFSLVVWVAREVEEMAEKEKRRREIEAWRYRSRGGREMGSMILAPRERGLAEVVETVLDKGLVINADIQVFLAGTELLSIRLRAALASFETAAYYGLAFPSGTDLTAPGWKRIREREPDFSPLGEPEWEHLPKGQVAGGNGRRERLG
jgi:hypothetical protein